MSIEQRHLDAARTLGAGLGAPAVVGLVPESFLASGIPVLDYGLAALAVTGLLHALRAALRTIERLTSNNRPPKSEPPKNAAPPRKDRP